MVDLRLADAEGAQHPHPRRAPAAVLEERHDLPLEHHLHLTGHPWHADDASARVDSDHEARRGAARVGHQLGRERALRLARVQQPSAATREAIVDKLIDRELAVQQALALELDRRDALEIALRLLLGDIDRNAVTYYPNDEEYGKQRRYPPWF